MARKTIKDLEKQIESLKSEISSQKDRIIKLQDELILEKNFNKLNVPQFPDPFKSYPWINPDILPKPKPSIEPYTAPYPLEPLKIYCSEVSNDIRVVLSDN